VVASALSFLEANKIHINKIELAESLAKAEKYVGTMSGGMDQAISLLGKEGTALKIDFHPLTFQTATIPNNISFVVINSMVRAAKTENASLKYNRRAIECCLITALINKFINKKFSVKNNFSYIGSLKKECPNIYPLAVDYLLNNILNKESFTTMDISNLLDISVEELREKYLKLKDGSFFSEPEDGFKLKQRFRYIVNEANRVDEAVKALTSGAVNVFGELMNQSHQDAKNLYEISTPELDFLCEVALLNFAYGARLTGAGFGGCIISMVENNKVSQFVEIMKNQYFHGYLKEKNPELYPDNFDTLDKIFTCKPCKGADLLSNSYL
jgi:N-acetylgalactosamine kinase